MYGGQRPADYVKKFEQPYAPLLSAGVKFQASLGNHDRPEQVSLQAVQHERPALLHLRAQQRPLFRARQHADGPEAARLARRRRCATRARTGRSATSTTRCTRTPTRHGSSVDLRIAARADLRQVRRQRRLLRSRSCLRADQAPEGHLLLRVGLGRPAARGQHEPDRADGRVVRSGSELHGGRDRRQRDVLPGDLADRQDGGFRRDSPAGCRARE